MFYKVLILYCLIALFLTPFTIFAQVTVNTNQTAATLVSDLVGSGIITLNPSLTCDSAANGSFTATGTLLAMTNGIVLTNGHAAAVAGAEGPLISFVDGTPGDPSVAPLLPAGTATFDACILQFDMVAVGDTVSFNYQFGSEEYRNAVCSDYTDVFAFFISGPGITGTQNIALVPGTNIPVEINTVNDGIPGTVGGARLSNCTSIGPGSPFTAYYIDNTGGPYLTYRGFTEKFRAFSFVSPCDTYHLKLTIVDAGNAQYDSGVFLESGSLKTNSFHFNLSDSIGTTINGMDHTLVKGCSPSTSVTIISNYTLTSATTLALTTGGTAVSGVDYTPLPSSITIPAGDSTFTFTVTALTTPVTGPKTLILYLPSGCGAVDTLLINILDAPFVSMPPPTLICQGSSYVLNTTGSTGLSYNWSPAASLNNNTIGSPTATPPGTTVYTLTATLPGTACPAIVDTVSVTVDTAAIAILTPDTSLCIGQSITIMVSSPGGYTYSWSPAVGLSSTTAQDPIASPTVATTYSLIATSAEGGCSATDTIHIGIVNVSLVINTPDTSICKGNVVQVLATGPPGATYQWIPTAGIEFSTVIDPLIAPDTSATYVLYASVPGCTNLSDSFHIDVEPNPTLFVGNDRQVCQVDTIHINGLVSPGNYPYYTYNWTPAAVLNTTTAQTVVFLSPTTTTVSLTVNTPAGCTATDSLLVTVHPNYFASLGGDTTICPHDTVQLLPQGGAAYQWNPPYFLSNPNAADPLAYPIVTQTYTVIATSIYGCLDTMSVTITVQPSAILGLPDSVILYPGQTYQLNPQTNCDQFTWFPPAGLTSAIISNPIASPQVSTKYGVRGTTEWGCTVTDTVLIIVDPNTLLAVPNAFTPGSGPNNILSIIKLGEATLHYFRIFNRWGNMVFETDDIDAGWDGTYHGTPQPFDVYVYMVEAVTNTGAVFHKNGNVTLIR